MDLDNIILSKRSQSQKTRYYMILSMLKYPEKAKKRKKEKRYLEQQ